MNALDAAAELCRLAEVPNLAVWLELPVDAPPEQLRAALSVRRRQLQALLANPKHGTEARFVVRHGSFLAEACDALPAHLQDMTRRAEARHLPAIEMMLRGMQATHALSPARLRRLRQGAEQLGVRAETFDDLWSRVQLPPPAGGPTLRAPLPRSATTPPPRQPGIRAARRALYADLDVSAEDPPDALDDAYLARESAAASERERLRAQIAYRVLAHPAARERYDLRVAREGRPPGQPPERPRLSVAGRRVRPLPASGRDVIELELSPPAPEIATVETDRAWLSVSSRRVDLGAAEPRVIVSVDERRLPWRSGIGSVTVRAHGQRVRIEYRAPHFLHRMGRTLELIRRAPPDPLRPWQRSRR